MAGRDLSKDFDRFVSKTKDENSGSRGIARGFASLRRFVRAASAGESMLLVADVERGRLVIYEDAIIGSTLADIRDVVARAPGARGTLYVYAGKDCARVEADDLDDDLVQQLRNVVGLVPVQRLARKK